MYKRFLKSKKKKWCHQTVKEEALNYNHPEEFRKNARGAYNYAKRNNIFELVTSHMTLKKEGVELQDFLNAIKKVKTAKEFRLKYKRIYGAASKNGWLKRDEYLSLEKEYASNKHSSTKWNFKKSLNVLKTCKSKTEFIKKYKGAYDWSRRNNCLDELYLKCEIENQQIKYSKSLSIQIIKKEQYSTLQEVREHNNGLYSYIKTNRLQKDLSQYLQKVTKTYSLNELIEISRVKSSIDIQKENPAMYRALTNAQKKYPNKFKNKKTKVELRERKYQIELKNKLVDYFNKNNINNFIIKEEIRINLNNQQYGRLDLLIDLKDYNLKIPVELKHGKSNYKNISSQIDKYNQYFKEDKKSTETFLVSPTGRYGFSEKEFFYILNHLINYEEIYLPNSFNYIRKLGIS